MNPTIKLCIYCALGVFGLGATMAQSCDANRQSAERPVAYEIVRPKPEVQIVEVTRERPCHIEYHNTLVQQTTVYNVVTVAPAVQPREPRVRYSYVRN